MSAIDRVLTLVLVALVGLLAAVVAAGVERRNDRQIDHDPGGQVTSYAYATCHDATVNGGPLDHVTVAQLLDVYVQTAVDAAGWYMTDVETEDCLVGIEVALAEMSDR